MKRKVEIVVLSDVHLGTYGCHAKELLSYLKSIKPEILILNGDIIDIWQFKKSYFPKEHLLVINRILKLLANGTKIYYITGNHDDFLRKFSNFGNGNFSLRNQLMLQVHGKKYWFFHGDVFDVSIMKARWLAKLGGKSYDLLILLNRFINFFIKIFGIKPISFAASVKKSVKKAVKFINDFEKQAIDTAAAEGYDFVVCGHVHQPRISKIGNITYLNSGDWVENLTALEYNDREWTLYKYNALDFEVLSPQLTVAEAANVDEEDIQIHQPIAAFVGEILKKRPQISLFPTEDVHPSGFWNGLEA